MSTVTNEDSIMNAIHAAVKQEIHKIIEEETAKAQRETERRIRGVADKLALSILSNYSLYEDAGRVIIEVKKNHEKGAT